MRFIWAFFVVANMSSGFAATLQEAEKGISGERILQHIRVLASDEFEGRAPATKGEELTVDYLVKQFKGMGLQPGNPDGSWMQDVPMVGVRSSSSIRLTRGDAKTEISFPDDYVGWSRL